MRLTDYAGLYLTEPLSATDYTWGALVQRLTQFVEATDKYRVAGFGAHVLKPNSTRGVEAVIAVTAAVFDVDAGTVEDVGECERRLRAAGLSAHFYSSHSHTPEKPALRLVLPLSRDLTPAEYPGIRAHLITTYAIPCKPQQSSDTSRFWFYPSHPPGRTPVTETLDGAPVDVDAISATAVPRAAPRPYLAPADFVPPPEPTEAVDLTPLRERIAKRADSLQHSKDPLCKERGRTLRALLKGEPLAEDGARNETILRVCGSLAFLLPGTPLSVFLTLLRPSLLAMRASDSWRAEPDIERMLLTAMAKRAAATTDVEELRTHILNRRAALDAKAAATKESK